MKTSVSQIAVELHRLQSGRAQLFVAAVSAVLLLGSALCGHGFWPVGFLLAFLFIATITDLSIRVIPNWLTGGAYVTVVAVSGLASCIGGVEGVIGWQESLRGSVTAVGIMLLCSRGGMGGGDIKLAGVLGAVLGPVAGMQIFIGTCAAAILALAVRRLISRRPVYFTERIPMAGFFLLSTVMFLLGAVR